MHAIGNGLHAGRGAWRPLVPDIRSIFLLKLGPGFSDKPVMLKPFFQVTHPYQRGIDMLVLALLRLVVIGLISACGAGGQSRTETRQGTGPDGAVTQGAKQGTKCFRVVNGTVTTAFPAVVLLMLKTNGQVVSTCTGFFVGKRTLLTASHCAAKRYDSFAFISANEFDREGGASIPAGIAPKTVIAPVIVEDAAAAQDRSEDVAAMVFDNDVAPAVLKIAAKAPSVKSKATVVGYGQTAVKVDGTPERLSRKRYGENIIGTVADGIISFLGPMVDAGLPAHNGKSGGAPGDSGGPLLVNGQVVGVVSGGFGQPDETSIYNIFADINSSYAQDIRQAAKDAGGDIGVQEEEHPDNLPDDEEADCA